MLCVLVGLVNSGKMCECLFLVKRVHTLKAGYVIFLKRFRKPSRGRVPKQTCSQSAVRGVSTHDMEERERSVNSRAELQKDRDGG